MLVPVIICERMTDELERQRAKPRENQKTLAPWGERLVLILLCVMLTANPRSGLCSEPSLVVAMRLENVSSFGSTPSLFCSGVGEAT